MAKRLFTDNAVSLLASGISASATSLTVLPGHGAMFPTPAANEFFCVTLEDQAAINREIVHVTQRTGDVFTIQRGQEGTTARAWSATTGSDTLVDHRVTAQTLYYLKDDPVPDDYSYTHPAFPALTTYKAALDYLLNLDPAAPPDLTAINNAIAQLQQSVATLQGDLALNNAYSHASFPDFTTFKDALDYLLDPDFYVGLQEAITDLQTQITNLQEAGKNYQNQNYPALTTYDLALDYLLQGNAVSGGQVIDAEITTSVAGSQTIISLPSAYQPNSTAVYVGGVRQKRGVDFVESGASELRLQYVLTPSMITEGQNVVVDYVVA